MLVASEVVRSLQQRVRAAATSRTAIVIRAGGTKDFYGNATRVTHEVLDPRAYCGVIDYEPTELVITACSGTLLNEIEDLLAKNNQMLAFEPPHYGAESTIGGTIASGICGPRRMTTGPVRDFVLGASLLDSRGEVLTFGGKVMKNVAGYDVSRALAGSLGTLGLILDASLKVVPRPASEQTLQFEVSEDDAIVRVNQWAGQPLPISATAWLDGVLTVRLSGSTSGVAAASTKLGGSAADESLWTQLRDQTHPFFANGDGGTLWRLSVPPTASPLALGATLIEWRGAQRWLWSQAPAAEIRARIAAVGGHAIKFRHVDGADVFHPLTPALAQIHRRLKNEFDQAGIFNPGRLYSDL